MDKIRFYEEMSKILEVDCNEKELSKAVIGTDIDSLAMLNIISFYEENFNITLDLEKFMGKNLEDLYKLIG